MSKIEDSRPRRKFKLTPRPVSPSTLSERDSLRVLNLLQNPPAPNAKLLAAAQSLPKAL
jgi:hypothetical protein